MMKLVDVLREECIVVGAVLDDKDSAMREIVRSARKSPVLKDVPDHEILDGLKEREAVGSTGFGNGIAIPHCRVTSATDFVVGLITVPAGVEFEALDDRKVNLIVFIVAPERATNEHIRLLSSVSQALLVPGAVDEMLAESTTEAVRESFLRHTRADIDTKDRTTKNLIHMFVQDEDIFRELIQAMTVTESSSIVVIDAENTGVYLAKIPLFAGLWRDKPRTFSRIIVAVVEKTLTNETLRRIESITGDLDERTGVMVTIQETAYTTGSLGPWA